MTPQESTPALQQLLHQGSAMEHLGVLIYQNLWNSRDCINVHFAPAPASASAPAPAAARAPAAPVTPDAVYAASAAAPVPPDASATTAASVTTAAPAN